MNKKVLYSLFALSTIGVSTSASASTITNQDLTSASPFGGFDWSSNGTAITNPAPLFTNQQIIHTIYFADAVAINKEGGGTFTAPNLLSGAPGTAFAVGQYEYTIVGKLSELVNCGGASGDPCLGAATFTPESGTFAIYYDKSGLAGGNTVADQVKGTGFTDGTQLLSGTLSSDPSTGGTFDPIKGGSFNFRGEITTTNSTYITPDQNSQQFFTTLQFGSNVTTWKPATGSPGQSGAADTLPPSFIQAQADANQSFSVTTIPEPGSVALIGIGMFGLFAARKRFKSF